MSEDRIVGRQLLAPVPLHRWRPWETSTCEREDKTIVSDAGVKAFHRRGWVWVQQPQGKARRAARGALAGWVGSALVIAGEERVLLYDSVNQRSIDLGPAEANRVVDLDTETVVFESRGWVWQSGEDLRLRPLWRGTVSDAWGGYAEGTSGREKVYFRLGSDPTRVDSPPVPARPPDGSASGGPSVGAPLFLVPRVIDE